MVQRTCARGLHWMVAALAAATLGAAAAPAEAVGTRDHAFTASSVAKPTGEKPQSKLWYAHGSWWGALFHPVSGQYRIHRFEPFTQSWGDTGVLIDDRNSSHADALWDGTYLYVASADRVAPGDIALMRFAYVGGTWVRDATYDDAVPVAGPIEAVVLEADSSGVLWIAFAQGNAVRVAHTGAGGAWGGPFRLPGSIAGAANLTADDIAAVVAFDGHVGVMWSNQNDQAMYFATHVNGAADTDWAQETALSGPLAADDHINLKSIQGTGGRVFAVVKTSKGDATTPDPLDPQVVLLHRAAGGTWTPHTFGTVADDHTRPIVLTDGLTGTLYVLATSPTNPNAAQTIYMKVTSLASPSFAAGAGTAFMGAPGFDVNDASSTKQDLGALPNGLVVAGDATNYWHNTLDLAHPPPTPIPIVTPTPKRPVLSSLAVRPKRFRVAGRAPRGARVSYRLSGDATVRLTVERAARGRRVGGACVRPSRGNRGRRACTRFVRMPGAIRRPAHTGANRTRFRGRIGGRRLAPGGYRLAALASSPAGTSATRRARFRVLRPAGAG